MELPIVVVMMAEIVQQALVVEQVGILVLRVGIVALTEMMAVIMAAQILMQELVEVEQGPQEEILLEHITITMVAHTEVTKVVMEAMVKPMITGLAPM